MTQLTNRIEQFLAPVLHDMGLSVVRIMLSGSKRQCLQVMLERQDYTPVTMEDCVAASREISVMLDVEDPIEGSYRLEVTSPGLDRPLVKAQDYQRFLGERIRIQTQTSRQGRRKFTGVLVAADTEGFTLQVEDGEAEAAGLEFMFSEITQAKLDPDLDFNTLIRNKANKDD